MKRSELPKPGTPATVDYARQIGTGIGTISGIVTDNRYPHMYLTLDVKGPGSVSGVVRIPLANIRRINGHTFEVES